MRSAVSAILLIVGLRLLTPALAADEAPTIATDRPSVANSSTVVPAGWLQLENGLQVTDVGAGATLDFPESSLRYGLLARTELRLLVPDYFYSTVAGAPGGGFGDLALGVKQQIGPVGGFDLSIIAFSSLPTGAAQLSSHGYDPGLQLPWSRTLADNWTVAGQIAGYWPTVAGRRNPTTEATGLLDHTLNPRWDVFGELAVDSPQHGGTRPQLHAGTLYRLTSRQQIDLHAAAGLSHAAPRNYVGVGYSVLLQGP